MIREEARGREGHFSLQEEYYGGRYIMDRTYHCQRSFLREEEEYGSSNNENRSRRNDFGSGLSWHSHLSILGSAGRLMVEEDNKW